ncbi:hypothetical protein HCN44_009784 [Aphidius gifuensis]|uniref:Enkurin domain-containing protein n=1 Tax=Aphidius gifuensis TaxID=684658 RepID=A0A834Y8G0_APHGI|nr:myb-like protein AA [Aphidius gifuensis]KAF7998386.1 hypothetical protein HCN44_009784 [Aphidius gifuensis]
MTTLKGVFPDTKLPSRKNFIQENVKNLRRMEQFFHPNNNKDNAFVADLQQKLKISKQQNKYQNVAPKINCRMQGSNTPNNNNNNVIKIKKTEKHLENLKNINDKNNFSSTIPPIDIYENNKTFRNQGMQTIGDGDLVQLYAEGTIRYPSGRGPRKSPLKLDSQNHHHHHHHHDETHQMDLNLPSEKGDAGTNQSIKNHQKNLDNQLQNQDFDCSAKINKGKTTLAMKIAAQLNNGTVPPSYRKGVVPKYIKERKEEKLQQEIKAQADAEFIADCPDGHVPLPDNERKDTLKKLKKNYQDFVTKLNMIPIRSDTLRSQRQKIEIEKELNKLEEGIKVFSRPKVFIKINA